MCNCPPAPPGPFSYITFGVLTTAGAASLGLRIATIIVGVRVPNPALNVLWSLATIGLAIAAACVLGRISIRKVRVEAAETRAELAEIKEQLRALEDQAWWGQPAGAEDTVELGPNVVALATRPDRLPKSG